MSRDKCNQMLDKVWDQCMIMLKYTGLALAESSARKREHLINGIIDCHEEIDNLISQDRHDTF